MLTHEWIFIFGENRKRLNRTIPNNIKEYEKRHGKGFVNGIEGNHRGKEDKIVPKKSKAYLSHQLHSVIQQTPELTNLREKHPAMFPVGLPAEYIKAMTKENEIVTDAFLGSGTTMVAAHQLNRKCYGMEIDSKYCQIIIDRMQKLDPDIEIKRNGEPYQCNVLTTNSGKEE
jgi:DNA modification methylase